MGRRLALLTLALAVPLVFAACRGGDATPAPAAARPTSLPSATPAPTPTPLAPPVAGGGPPLAPRDGWAYDRVEAILQLYTFTPQAAEAVRALRVHHVLGRPGWFGSTGYRSWLGIGQARPSSIVHEISHSLWGAFPVAGRPELSWDAGPGGELSPGIQAQRRDLEIFMRQPPDAFEPLRARLRLIPDLVSGSGYPGLYHLGEAEIIYFTGGNLDLVPPVLRKYYGPLLSPGTFESWDEAIQWYLRLPGPERRVVDAYFGVGSMPLDTYDIGPGRESRIDEGLAAVVVAEERQRLIDFIDQFDLYFQSLDEGGPVAGDVRFWRGYLRDIKEVFRAHPDVAAARGPRAQQIAGALRFLLDLDEMPPEERVEAARDRVLADSFVVSFTPAIDNVTLARLAAGGGGVAEARAAELVREALDPFHVRLLDLAVELQRLAAPAQAGAEAAAAFDRFLRGLTEHERKSMNFILEVLSEVDRPLTRRVLTGITPEMARSVNDEGPAFTRFLLTPEELVSVLGFGDAREPARIAELALLLNENVSATPWIDEPFLEAVYRLIVELGRGDPGGAIRLFAETGLLLEPFLVNMPEEAAALFARDIGAAAEVFETANPVRLPAARAVYRLVQADPELAARITVHYEERGAVETVDDALLFFAYDLPRQRTQPALPISLENDAAYLGALAALQGGDWLEAKLARALRRYRERIAEGEVGREFLQTYRETLEAGIATIGDSERRLRLEAIVAAAFAAN